MMPFKWASASFTRNLTLSVKCPLKKTSFLEKNTIRAFSLTKQAMIKKSREVFQPLGGDIDPREKVSNLNVAYQQLVEIAKAILNKAKLIIMDEPSAALCTRELEIFFNSSVNLKGRHLCYLYFTSAGRSVRDCRSSDRFPRRKICGYQKSIPNQ